MRQCPSQKSLALDIEIKCIKNKAIDKFSKILFDRSLLKHLNLKNTTIMLRESAVFRFRLNNANLNVPYVTITPANPTMLIAEPIDDNIDKILECTEF